MKTKTTRRTKAPASRQKPKAALTELAEVDPQAVAVAGEEEMTYEPASEQQPQPAAASDEPGPQVNDPDAIPQALDPDLAGKGAPRGTIEEQTGPLPEPAGQEAEEASAIAGLLRLAENYRSHGLSHQAIEMYLHLARQYGGSAEGAAARRQLMQMADQYERAGQRRLARWIYEELAP